MDVLLFDAAEVSASGHVRVTGAQRTLRTDTACIALLAPVHDRLAPPSAP